jgi:apolipoprotein N-acyltransferase
MESERGADTSGAGAPRVEVHAYTAIARVASMVLRALAALNFLYLAYLNALDVVTGTRLVTELGLVAQALFFFSVLPWGISLLIRRMARASVEVSPTHLVLSLRGSRYEIPLASITGLRPLLLPFPSPGIGLVMSSGRLFRHRLLSADPSVLLSALDARLSLAANALRHPAVAYAQARHKTARQRWIVGLAQFFLLPLAVHLLLFRLHQMIVFGGPFGQYHLLGLAPYLASFARHWAGVAGAFVVLAGVLRLFAEVSALLLTWIAPSRARLVRRITEGFYLVGYFGLVPAYLVFALLLQ